MQTHAGIGFVCVCVCVVECKGENCNKIKRSSTVSEYKMYSIKERKGRRTGDKPIIGKSEEAGMKTFQMVGDCCLGNTEEEGRTMEIWSAGSQNIIIQQCQLETDW